MSTPAEATYTLTVVDLSERQFHITLDAASTVLQLKQLVRLQNGAPADQQRLIYKGRALNDDDLLLVYGIQNEATIHLVLKLRGS